MKNWEQEKSRVGDLLKKASEKWMSKTTEQKKQKQDAIFKSASGNTYSFPQKDDILPVQKPELPPYATTEDLPRIDPAKIPDMMTEKNTKWEPAKTAETKTEKSVSPGIMGILARKRGLNR